MDKVDEEFLKKNDSDLLKATTELKKHIETKYEEKEEQIKRNKEKSEKAFSKE